MDNNFNQQPGQNQMSAQPAYQQNQMPAQPVYQQYQNQNQMSQQQVPVQPMYQQPAQPTYPQAPKMPSQTNSKELLALIFSGAGTLLAVLGSIFTCSCSASKTYDAESMVSNMMGALGSMLGGGSSSSNFIDHSTSAVLIVALLGAVLAALGAVFGVLAIKDKNATVKAGKMSYIAMAVGVFGFMYGVLPVLTICGYNCSLDSSMSDMMGSSMKDLLK